MKEINDQAPVKCCKSITINTSSEKVWAVLTDIDQWPVWNKDIAQAKVNGELKPGTTFIWKSGGLKIRSTLHTVDTCLQFGWTGTAFGAFAIHNWTLTENDDRTTVLVEESMEGLLVGLFKKSFNKKLESQMQRWLDSLKLTCEHET